MAINTPDSIRPLSKSGIVLGQDAEPQQLIQVIDALSGNFIGRLPSGTPTIKGSCVCLRLSNNPYTNVFTDDLTLKMKAFLIF